MVNVNPIETQKYLKGMGYPASKDEVVAAARDNGAPDDVLEALESMQKDSFDGPNAVMSALKDAGATSGG